MPGAKSHYKGRKMLSLNQCRLKELRALRGMTQHKLDEAAGLRRGYISYLEKRGNFSVNAEVLKALCKALECNSSDLTYGAYRDPAIKRKPPVPTKCLRSRHSAFNPGELTSGKRYLLDGKKYVLDFRCNGNNVVHYIFRRLAGNWRISYTDRDFNMGDVIVRPL